MAAGEILTKTSFANFVSKDKVNAKSSEQAAVRDLFDQTYPKAIDRTAQLKKAICKETFHLFEGHFTATETYQIFKNRTVLSDSVALYQWRMNQIDPVAFRFIPDEQKNALEKELLFAFYLFAAQYHLDEVEHRNKTLKGLRDNLNQCAILIHALQYSKEHLTAETQLRKRVSESEKPFKFSAIELGRLIAAKAYALTSVTAWTETLTAINDPRLYWVWGEGMLASIMALLPETFARKKDAERALTAPDDALGYLGWMLYYTRFGLNTSLLLEHTLPGPWMSKRERIAIPALERFKTQWDQRKFVLLNDSVWATVNLVTFFWLNGKGMLGYAGDVLTVGLLMADTALTFWQVMEESTQHNAELHRLSNDISNLKHFKSKAEKEGEYAEAKKLTHQMQSLEKMSSKRKMDWTFKKYHLAAGIAYSVGLLAAFTVACCFLFPPGAMIPATAMTIALVGAALCFGATLAYSLATGAIDIAHTHKKGKLAKQEYKTLLQRFCSETDDNQKKLLYLEMKQLKGDSEFQTRVAKFQAAKLIRSVMIDVMIPPLVFVSLMFMPIGVGLGVLAAGFALAVVSKLVLNRFEPKAKDHGMDKKTMDELLAFDDDYQAFDKQAAKELQQLNRSRGLLDWIKSGSQTPQLEYKPLPDNDDLDASNSDKLKKA